ncbi:hypothetical protein [Nocardia asiatica]|uniref:hypothetical protein n=1 Tax=Nocardia asiatica TaxID=209252 RepID=UPI002455491F|nr:hypothetical protein [Nocardia asiatica]
MTATSEKSWTFYWLTGQREVLPGSTAADALNRAGYGAGAIRALDFFAEGDRDDSWTWNSDTRNWVKADES